MKLIINFPVYFVMFCINSLKIYLYLHRISTVFSETYSVLNRNG